MDEEFIEELNQEMGPDSKFITQLMENIIANAILYCSFASVKSTLGYSEGDGALIVPDDQIEWSGPPGVIKLSADSEVQLSTEILPLALFCICPQWLGPLRKY